VNTTFTKVAVMNAGNLTVRNFLDVRAGGQRHDAVAGARVIVQDNAVEVWNRRRRRALNPGSGDRPCLHPVEHGDGNVTSVRVTYRRNFVNSPRGVDMATSHVSSSRWSTSILRRLREPALDVQNSTPSRLLHASDGTGRDSAHHPLYRQGESMVWIKFVTQAAAPSGSFAFVATSNGHYEVRRDADDLAGNKQPGPLEQTLTLIDTLAPVPM